MKGFSARDRLERFDQMSNETDDSLCVSDGWVALLERGGIVGDRRFEFGGTMSSRELGGTVSSRSYSAGVRMMTFVRPSHANVRHVAS